jgi:molybdopterin-guanine dinucleotide biosynthesis protein A
MVSDLTDNLRSWLFAVRKCHRAHKWLQVPHVHSSPLIQHVVRMAEQVSQCVVVCHDKELRATFKVTPPILDRLAYG